MVDWLKICSWSETGKKILYSFYKMYAREVGLTVENLKFEWTKKIPFIPSEDMIDTVINSARSMKTRNTLRILKMTGIRIGELASLRFENCTAIVKTEKARDGHERVIALPEWFGHDPPKQWMTKIKRIQGSLRKIVKNLAVSTDHVDYLKIHPHTFRHYFATNCYAVTQDIMLVKELLGHSDMKYTQVYVQLVRAQRPKKEVRKIEITDSESMMNLVKCGWRVAVQTENFTIFEKPMFP